MVRIEWRQSKFDRGTVRPCLPVFIGAMFLLGCSLQSSPNTPSSALRLATTTSTRDSGLLDELVPPFEREQDCRIDVIAVGTGAALKLGAAGDADVILVHARRAEEAFMAAGHGTRHEEFMFNDFVILGPPEDPAQIRDLAPVEALQRIARSEVTFVSRGDNSGTHRREVDLWDAAGEHPTQDNYLETGQGMGATLVIADEKRGYVLADLGTYLRYQDKVELTSLAAASESLRNPYAAIVVNGDKHPHVNASLGSGFVDYLISRPTQQRIAKFTVSGQPLFRPTRLSDSE